MLLNKYYKIIILWYGMVWYGMVWYGMVWYGMVWYGNNLFDITEKYIVIATILN